MHDLSITIIDEHTKRVSRNLALTHTRRRTITIEDPPSPPATPPAHQDKATSTRPAAAATTTITTKAVGKTAPNRQRAAATTLEVERSPSSSSSLTVAVPYSNFKVWTEHDKDQNLLLHIKAPRQRRKLPMPRCI